MDAGRAFLDEAIANLKAYKRQAEQAMEQLTDEQFFSRPSEVSNSVAVLVKHMGGNLRSRWRGFLTSDGEKADRDRDSEFVIRKIDSRDSLMASWEAGWETCFAELGSLQPEDLGRTITIRGKPMTALQAIVRSLTHASGHVSQIVYAAKFMVGDSWKTLSIERGKSREYNQSLGHSPRR